MIVLNSNRCLNSTFGFGVSFVWSIIYTYTCISISSKEAWKQVGKKYALIQPYCKTAWIYSPKIDFTSSSKNPKEITHKQSFDNGRLWNMNASYTIMSQRIFWCLSDLQFTATLIKHSWGQACPSCSIISIFNTVESFCSYVFVCFFWVKLIFLYHYHCLCSLPIFFLFSS